MLKYLYDIKAHASAITLWSENMDIFLTKPREINKYHIRKGILPDMR